MEAFQISKNLSEHIADGFQSILDEDKAPDNFAACVDAQVQDVCHKGYDGFIPFTNGGLDLMMLTDLQAYYGSGTQIKDVAIKNELDEMVDNSLKDVLSTFVIDNKEKLSSLFTPEQLESPDEEFINYHTLYDKNEGQLAEDLSMAESDYLAEGGSFWYQFRVLYFSKDNSRSESGENELLFMAGVNTDLGYGRDKGLEITYEKCVPLKGLNKIKINKLLREMVGSI